MSYFTMLLGQSEAGTCHNWPGIQFDVFMTFFVIKTIFNVSTICTEKAFADKATSKDKSTAVYALLISLLVARTSIHMVYWSYFYTRMCCSRNGDGGKSILHHLRFSSDSA